MTDRRPPSVDLASTSVDPQPPEMEASHDVGAPPAPQPVKPPERVVDELAATTPHERMRPAPIGPPISELPKEPQGWKSESSARAPSAGPSSDLGLKIALAVIAVLVIGLLAVLTAVIVGNVASDEPAQEQTEDGM